MPSSAAPCWMMSLLAPCSGEVDFITSDCYTDQRGRPEIAVYLSPLAPATRASSAHRDALGCAGRTPRPGEQVVYRLARVVLVRSLYQSQNSRKVVSSAVGRTVGNQLVTAPGVAIFGGEVFRVGAPAILAVIFFDCALCVVHKYIIMFSELDPGLALARGDWHRGLYFTF